MKNVVFCADGTWNGPGQDEVGDKSAPSTNVFKFFSNLDGTDSADDTRMADEQERMLTDGGNQLLQAAKYIHGVGDSANFLVKALGGTMGAGIISRIVRGYTFVSRNYIAGDKIFLIGFSRGAYTARALAGLIAAKGLLDATKLDLAGDKDQAYRLGAAVWYDHQHALLNRVRTNLIGQLEDLAADMPAFLSRPATADLVATDIEAVAVWDTVGALGIPDYNNVGGRIDPFQFANNVLSPKVRTGIHVVSLDEQRNDFIPALWSPDPRITQVLFPGAHADVGGGYPTANNESGLSDTTFRWMTDCLAQLRVLFAANPAYVASPDPLGVAHQPWLVLP